MNDSLAAMARVPDRALVKPAWIVLIAGWLLMLVPFPGTGVLGVVIAGVGGFILAVVNLVRGVIGAGVLQLIGALLVTPVVYFIGLAIFGVGVLGASTP